MKRIAILLLAASAGCANYQPIVDTKGVDMNRYHVDLRECQGYASQVNAGEHAAAGAVAGAVLGGIIGALVGGRQGANFGASTYGVTGAAAGGAQGAQAQRGIILECLKGRGYRALY
jgi:uncharacterized protein YcfJ